MEIIQRKQEKKWVQTGTAGKNSFLTLKTLDSWSLSKNRICTSMCYESAATNFKSFWYPSRELWIFSHCCAKRLTTTKIFILSFFCTPHSFGHPPSMSYYSPLLFYVDNLIIHLWLRSKHDKYNANGIWFDKLVENFVL